MEEKMLGVLGASEYTGGAGQLKERQRRRHSCR